MMARQIPRLFVADSLTTDAVLPLSVEHMHYLHTVLRLKAGAQVHVFNGRDGAWSATLRFEGKKQAHLLLETCIQTQPPRTADVHYLFAPLKAARLDYMIQKATEMGATRLIPVRTARTHAAAPKIDRMIANALEAAEQCGALSIPEIMPEQSLEDALDALEAQRTLIFCDEEAPAQNTAHHILPALKKGQPVAILIGPEGGVSPQERERIIKGEREWIINKERESITEAQPQAPLPPAVLHLSLGTRILRADTAAVAVLALVQSYLE
jgi:16S rRNA (uracil1498-N3)-methyltransferase